MNTEQLTYNLELTEEDIKYIQEALIFSSTVDANASWYKEDFLKLKDLAIKIRRNLLPDIVLIENIEMFNSSDIEEYHDEHTEEILQNFSDIKYIKSNDL